MILNTPPPVRPNSALNELVWIAGLAFLFFHRDGKPFRLLGWLYLRVGVILAAALTDAKVRAALAGQEPRRVIVVPGRLVNVVL